MIVAQIHPGLYTSCVSRRRSLRSFALLHVDVAVVGGGPAGLAAAAALQVATAGKSIHVFERTAMKSRGAAIIIGVNGLKALHAISPALLDTLLANAIQLEGADRYDCVTGELLGSRDMRNQQTREKYGFSAALLGWSDITTALKSALPEGTLHPSCPITSYRVLPDNTIQLLGPRPLGSTTPSSSNYIRPSSKDDSSSEQHVVATCDLLLGADGWFSPIRQQLLGDGPPAFKGVVLWRGRVRRPNGFPGNRIRRWVPSTGGGASAVVFPVPGDEVAWQCHCPVGILAERGVSFQPVTARVAASCHADPDSAELAACMQPPGTISGGALPKERCLQVFTGFPAPLTDLVAATPVVMEHGLYERTPEQMPDGSWGVGNVTLAGDAAHAAGADGNGPGPGLALSLEDAAVLGWHVQQLGLTPTALRAYEAERIPHVKAIFELAARQAAAPRGSQSPAAKAASRELRYGQAKFRPLGHVVPAQCS